MENVTISKSLYEINREKKRDKKVDERSATQNELLEVMATVLGNAFLEQNQLLAQQNELLAQQNEILKAQTQIMRRIIDKGDINVL